MRYYVVSDVHGFYTPLIQALTDVGFFDDVEPHKLIVLGDLMDRGRDAVKIQNFILEQMEKDAVILIRGNHEDLYESLVTQDCGIPYDFHLSNGTYDTALQLTGFDPVMARIRNFAFANAGKGTPFYRQIMPAMRDYFETEHYVFVHGWIPCVVERGMYCPIRDWRNAPSKEWKNARWYNGMDAAQTADEDKTIICGHWRTSYGHSKYEGKGSEFGPDADFSPKPYYQVYAQKHGFLPNLSVLDLLFNMGPESIFYL